MSEFNYYKHLSSEKQKVRLHWILLQNNSNSYINKMLFPQNKLGKQI